MEHTSRPLPDLAASDDMARAMVDAAPDALVMVGEDGIIELVNHQSEVLFGYDRGELLGRPVEVLLPEKAAAVHRAHRTRYRVSPEVRAMGSGMDLWARRADGTALPVEISLSPLIVGGRLRVIAAVRDVSARKASEAAAWQLRRGIDSIADGVYMVDPETMRFVYVNHGATVQCGFNADELLDGMTPLHFAADFTAAELKALLAPILDGSTTQLRFETVLRPKSGIDFPVEAVIEYPELDKDQQRVLVIVVRDISERVAAQEQARLIEHSIDSVSDAVFMCDEETLAFIHVNQGAVDMHGYSREELLAGMSPADLAPALSPDEIHAVLGRLALAPEQSARLRTEGHRKDGSTVPVEVQIDWPAAGREGGTRPIMALVRDIGDQVASEAAVRASEARFRAAFDEGPVPMTIVEARPPDQRVMIDVNQALADLFGYTREELIGRPASDLIHPDNVLPDASVASAVAAGRDVEYERLIRGTRSDGAEIWLQRHASALDPDGDQDKLIIHVVDVTAEIEASLARSRQEALTGALSTVRLNMLQGASRTDGLTLICKAAIELLNGAGAVILTPTGNSDELAIEASAGVPASVRARMQFRSSVGAVAEVFDSAEPRHINAARHSAIPDGNRQVLQDQHVGPILLAPLPVGDKVVGVLAVTRLIDAEPFTASDLDPIRQFAAGAVNAIELAQVRAYGATLELVEDRERIARDMHDNVIGRLFATGMSLHAATTGANDPDLEQRLATAVNEIDGAIKEIRTTIYGIRSRTDWGKGVRGDVLALAAEQHKALGFEPKVDFEGALDELPSPIVDGVLATIREALTNSAKYAMASNVALHLTCTTTSLAVRVEDDGVGFTPSSDYSISGNLGGNGLTNMTARARALGGQATIASQPGHGTVVTWTVPLQ